MMKKGKISIALVAAAVLVPVLCDASNIVVPSVPSPALPIARMAPPRQLSQAVFVKAAPMTPKKIVAEDGRESLGVKTTAGKIYVADLVSGTELYSANADAATPIASITKLMTALVVLDTSPDWNRLITMESPSDGGGVAYFFTGDQVTVRDLWKAMLVGSSNSAASALAASTGLGKRDFVSRMNAKAAVLGLTDTSFVEPTGLDPRNVSTARDVAALLKTAAAKKEVSDAVLSSDYALVKTTGKTVRIVATDKLLESFMNKRPYKILGAKTGYIDESGHNIAVEFSKDGAGSVVVVVLGSVSDEARFQEAKSLAYWAFENFNWPKMATENDR